MLDHIIQRILRPPCHGNANGQPRGWAPTPPAHGIGGLAGFW